MNIDNIQKRLNEVRNSYISSLTDKKMTLQTLWQELQSDWQAPKFDEFYIIIHSLAGSAGTFELPEITDTARAIVDLFKENKTSAKKPSEALLTKLDSKLSLLLKAMEQAK